jgi:hypothetical protein
MILEIATVDASPPDTSSIGRIPMTRSPTWRVLRACSAISWCTSAILIALLGTALAADPPQFEEQLIAGNYGYTFAVNAHDLDGDGDLDLTNVDIVGKRPSSASLLWFENDGRGSFARHVIHKNEDGWLERHALGDINGDGRADIAVVSNRDGLLLWFEHPGEQLHKHWTRHVISTSCPHAYDVALADLDGDGDLDAVSAGYVSHTLAWYENPGAGGLDAEWTRHVIDDTLVENRTVAACDMNADGRIDLLASCVGQSFSAVPADGASSDHGAAVVWFENTGAADVERWKKHVIDNESRGAIHGHPVDVDADGDLDVIMAFGMRPEHIPEERHEIVWYEDTGQAENASGWKRHLVGPFPCAFEAIAADIDGDNDVDFAATSWSKGDRVAWFENVSGDPRGKWTPHVLKEPYYAANQIIAADLDGNGRLDLVATADDGSRRVKGANELRWWRNLGGK